MKSSVKILKGLLFVLLTFTLLFSCKKPKNNGETNNNDETAVHIAAIFNTTDGAALKYQQALQANKDSIDAFLEMGKWVIQQPDVEKAFVINLGALEVQYKSGLTSIISIVANDASGERLLRGSGTSNVGKVESQLSLTNNFGTANEEFYIKNKKVLVFNPVSKEFYNDIYPYTNALSKNKHELDVKVVSNEAANLSVIHSFKDYGLILINSHGFPQGFLINNDHLTLTISHLPGSQIYTDKEIKAMFIEANNLPLEKFANKELIMLSILNVDKKDKSVYINLHTLVTDKYIRNLPKLDNAIVLGNYCYSGWSSEGINKNNVAEAFRSIGAVAYYGYAYPDGTSGPVDNPFAIQMEGYLINSLLKDDDSTGVAHLKDNKTLYSDYTFLPPNKEKLEMVLGLTRSTRLFTTVSSEPIEFVHFFSPQYKYGCGTLMDERDSQVYKLACIGNARWMAENLRYNAAGSLFAHNDNSTLGIYGRLYNYPMASAGQGSTQGSATIQGICPKGWHIPNQLDWENLVSALNATDEAELAVMLQSPSALWLNDPDLGNKKRNSSEFSALPAGSAFRTSKTAPIGYNPNNANFVLSTKDAGVISPEKVLSISIKQATTGGQSASASLSGGQWVYPDATPTGDSYYSCRCVENK